MPFEIAHLDRMQPSARQSAATVAATAARLLEALEARQPELARYNAYYEGDHRLTFATAKFREAFGAQLEELADNWCELVVDAVEERLDVEGFRTGDSIEGDSDAWDVWQRNGMDALSQILHTETLIQKIAYVMVGPDGTESSARVTVESPIETIVAWDRSDHRKRLAALKRWTDSLDGADRATLWLPDGVWRFQGETVERENGEPHLEWTLIGNEVDKPAIAGVVPFVPFRNKPRLRSEGKSEIAGVIPVQDAINKMVCDLLVTSEFHAAPQRWATGLELPTDPTSGQPIDPYKDPHLKRFFYVEEPNAQMGQFDGADLSQFVKVVEMLVQHIASQTRTPPHYFVVGGEPPSGESIKSAETGLVAKARRKMRHLGESHEDVMRLVGKIAGIAQLEDPAMETIWADPESRTEGEHVDATLKKQALGVPQDQLWEDIGYTPQQRARFRTMNAADRLLAPPPPDVPLVP